MSIKERIESLVTCGEVLRALKDEQLSEVIEKAQIANPWFTGFNIKLALNGILNQFLSKESLHYLGSKYQLDDKVKPKTIGLVLAGNIPFVGFHDILCCYLTGHYCQIKLSDKDSVLMQFIIEKIINQNPDNNKHFSFVNKLQNYDAIIATGSNSTAQYFEHYFKDVPHIIRKNRNAVAVIEGSESDAELTELGGDVFSYFGLGCRNVSKIFVPSHFDITRLFIAFEPYREIIYHNKYKNNYDYNVALNLLNKETFLQNDFMLLKKATPIISRIGSIHYTEYNNKEELMSELILHKTEIQCILSQSDIPSLNTIKFGQAQNPKIDDYADGVDSIQFLLSI